MANGKITTELLAYSIYSVNKFAKNHRDAALNSCGKDRVKHVDSMTYLYLLKEEVLNHFTPVEIHKQVTSDLTYKTYSENSKSFKRIKGRTFVAFDYNKGKYVKYKKSSRKTRKTIYYLYYKLDKYKFHIPVNEEEAELYEGLPVVRLPKNFYIDGAPEESLLDESEAVNNLLSFLGERSCNESL